jgi:hypothetical protein
MKTMHGRINASCLGFAILAIFVSTSAGAAISDCAVDYDLDTNRTVVDVQLFLAAYGAGSSNADLNGDRAVDGFDLNTFFAYFGFNPCPWKGDYQYNRIIDTVDGVFFQYLYGAGSLRADLDNDSFVTPADFGLFIAGFGSAY